MKRIIVIISICLFISCSSPTDNSINLTINDIPIVNWLAITNSTGNTLGIWYNPGYTLTFKNAILPKRNSQKEAKYKKQNNINVAGIEDGYDILPSGFSVGLPYPNPLNGSVTFKFAIPRFTEVSVWVGPASLGLNNEEDIKNFGNHVFLSHNGIAIKELISSKSLHAGYHAIVWHTDDFNNISVPSGFYRIYFLFDEYMAYRDVFVANDWSDLPESMKLILNL
jgi:hypothetical protein